MPAKLTATVPYMNLTLTLHFITGAGATIVTGLDVDADPGTEVSAEVWDSIDWDVLTMVARRKIMADANREGAR
jgi:microcystin degradation protein MlrC